MTAAVVGLIVATALNGYRLDAGPIGIRPEHLVFVVVAAAWARRLVRERRGPLMLGDDWILLGLLVVAALASLLHAPQPIESVKFLALMVFGVALYVVVRDVVTDGRGTFRVAIEALVAVGVVEGLLATVRWATAPFGVTWGGNLFGFAPGVTMAANCVFTFAPRGTLPEPSILGGYLGATSMIAMWLLLAAQTRSRRRWLAAATTIMLIGLGLTLSRGAWLALVGGLIVIVVAPHGSMRVKVGLVVVAATVVALAAFVSVALAPMMVRAVPLFSACEGPAGEVSVRADGGRSGGEQRPERPEGAIREIATTAGRGVALSFERLLSGRTLQFRWETYRTALVGWRLHPLVGNGANSFAQSRFVDPTGKAWISNLELMQLYDAGVLGLGLLLAWIARLGWDTLRTLRRAQGASEAAALGGLAVGFAVLLITYQTTSALWLGFTWIHLALIRGGTLLLRRSVTGG